jgi:hypothetical protein
VLSHAWSGVFGGRRRVGPTLAAPPAPNQPPKVICKWWNWKGDPKDVDFTKGTDCTANPAGAGSGEAASHETNEEYEPGGF